jgi:hypothetical protein
VALPIYSLLTGAPGVIIPYTLLFIGIMLLVTGITEFQKRKANAFSYSWIQRFCFNLYFIELTGAFVEEDL